MPKFRDQIWTMTGTGKYMPGATMRKVIYAMRDRLMDKGFSKELIQLVFKHKSFSHFDMEYIICRMRDHNDY